MATATVTATTVKVLAASALLLCAGLTPGPGAGTPPATDRARAGLGQCVATGPRATVEDLNHFVDTAAGVPGFVGADVGVDVRLEGARSIWFFGDTFQREPSGDRYVRNSAIVFTARCARLVEPVGGGALVPGRTDGVGYWPMSAWATGSGPATTVYVMLQRVADAPGSGLGFVNLGPSLAVFRLAESAAPQLVMRQDLGPDDSSPAMPEWGAAAALDGGWLYLYGTSTRDLPGVHGFALRVARVRPDLAADLSRWRFWDGVRWQPRPEDAVPLIDELGGVSQTLSVWPQQGRWYVLSKQNDFLGDQIAVWTGDTPMGPFGPAQAVADLPCDPATGELRYMPLAHPSLLPQAGTVVVSYSRNDLDLGDVCAAPTRYRPYFLRVTLPR